MCARIHLPPKRYVTNCSPTFAPSIKWVVYDLGLGDLLTIPVDYGPAGLGPFPYGEDVFPDLH